MRHRIPYLLAFLAGFQILVVELCAGRSINLYLGSSIYGWTALIGVVLAGVSLGNVIGGNLAGRDDVEHTLGEACALCALLVLAVLHGSSVLIYAVTGLASFAWPIRVFLVVLALLFLPSTAMGLISPLAAKWALTLRPEKPGEVLGTMAAFGTWGAIVGTFVTGFFLIGLLGTASLLITTSTLIGLMALYLLGAHQLPGGAFTYLLLGMAMVMSWPIPGRAETIQAANLHWANFYSESQVIYLDESNYFTVKVVEETAADGVGVLQLVLDQLVHGFVVPGDPGRLEYSYEHVYSWVTRRWAQRQPGFDPETIEPRALYLGGGSYTFPRWLERQYPRADQLVAEIDPRVVEAVYAMMELPRDTAIRTVEEDARRVVEHEPDGSWDLIYGDAFNGFSVPYHLTTLEFVREIRRVLAPDGVYMMNLIDLVNPEDLADARFVASMVRTLEAVFGEEHVHLYVDGNIEDRGLRESLRATFVVIATVGPFDLERLGVAGIDKPPSPGQPRREMTAITGDKLAELLREGRLLTDDFAPVDQLLAPVAATRAVRAAHDPAGE